MTAATQPPKARPKFIAAGLLLSSVQSVQSVSHASAHSTTTGRPALALSQSFV